MVIGTRVNLHFDFGAAGNRAVKKSFAWDRRNPDVFGADQYHERNGSRPRWLLPLLVARCRIEGYRRPKVTPRQLGRPAKALRADREEKSATALRPSHYANAIRPNKSLRLQLSYLGYESDLPPVRQVQKHPSVTRRSQNTGRTDVRFFTDYP